MLSLQTQGLRTVLSEMALVWPSGNCTDEQAHYEAAGGLSQVPVGCV